MFGEELQGITYSEAPGEMSRLRQAALAHLRRLDLVSAAHCRGLALALAARFRRRMLREEPASPTAGQLLDMQLKAEEERPGGLRRRSALEMRKESGRAPRMSNVAHLCAGKDRFASALCGIVPRKVTGGWQDALQGAGVCANCRRKFATRRRVEAQG